MNTAVALQPRVRGTPLAIRMVCPPNRTAVLKVSCYTAPTLCWDCSNVVVQQQEVCVHVCSDFLELVVDKTLFALGFPYLASASRRNSIYSTRYLMSRAPGQMGTSHATQR